jgi:hypothetical protein
MRLVRKFGEMWARNPENIENIPDTEQGGQGVYILYDGSMPVYVGKGNIKRRIRGARNSKSRSPFWDRFSWYLINNSEVIHDTEVLILRMLPPYLRSLTKQKGNFLRAVRDKRDKQNPRPDLISRKFPKKRRKKKS